MDFSASNPLNFAARLNDFVRVKKLLKKHNPNNVDICGWTCLHEAARKDSYESMLLILDHPDCSPLAEDCFGQTALYLACGGYWPIRIIQTLLEKVDDIANYCSTEMISPLHLASSEGKVDIIDLLIKHGAIVDVANIGGETPLHEATYRNKCNAVSALLHAGADPDILNVSGLTALHMACTTGCLKCVKIIHLFVSDINQPSRSNATPLLLAAQIGAAHIVQYLVDNGADPHLRNDAGHTPLIGALLARPCHSRSVKILLDVTHVNEIDDDIIIYACKKVFNLKILTVLFESKLGPLFFNQTGPMSLSFENLSVFTPLFNFDKLAPINSFLHVIEYLYKKSVERFEQLFYLFLMRGASVNPKELTECPPLVYLHYCPHGRSFKKVLKILLDHGCNVDYTLEVYERELPEVFFAALTTDGRTLPILVTYSLWCEPLHLMKFAHDTNIIYRIPDRVQKEILSLVDVASEGLNVDNMHVFIPTLKHLARVAVRQGLRDAGVRRTPDYLHRLECLPLPQILKMFLRTTVTRMAPGSQSKMGDIKLYFISKYYNRTGHLLITTKISQPEDK